MSYSAYFFDLGGTLVAIADDEIAVDAAGRVLPLPGAIVALTQLAGAPVFVITNQAGVALGHLSLDRARDYVDQVNLLAGGAITDYRICTHHPALGCDCRKPRPGMILDLAAAHGIDLSRALLVGDSPSDQACAAAAGVGTFRWAGDFFASYR